MSVVRLGTRGSALARRQTEHAIARLTASGAGVRTEARVLTTRGDMDRSTPLPAIGGKGLFTEELERALRDGEIDAAVHSLKDLPVESPQGLVIAAIFGRGDARDVLVSGRGQRLDALPRGASIGTSSTRRTSQVRAVRPDLIVRSIRGNVETRLGRVDAGDYDAVILAAAGLERLGLSARVTEFLDIETFLPAPGQGALAVQCRAEDDRVRGLLAGIDDPALRAATDAERAFLAALGGGCSLPVAALAGPVADGRLVVRGYVGAVDGTGVIRVSRTGSRDAARDLGTRLAEDALRQGAAELLP